MLQFKTKNVLSLNHLFFLFALLVLGTSCNTGKYLKEDQSFVNKNKIKFDTKEKVEKKRTLSYELLTLCKQQPNDKMLWLFKPRLWFYYKTNKPKDTTKIDRWIQRVIAEPPSIYDSLKTEETAKAMQYFLQHRGYYNAKVSFEETRKKKKSTITYHVDPFHIYTIDSVFFASKDTNIQQILRNISDETFLKKGDPVSVEAYNQEVERITKAFKNRGYAYFDRRFVDQLKGDSSGHKVNIDLNVLLPPDDQNHKVYKIGKIEVFDGYNPKDIGMTYRDSLIDGIHFMMNGINSIVKPQTILHSIYLKEGDIYKEDNFIKTNRQLRTLEVYKFISIKTYKNLHDDGKINFIIRLTPNPKIVLGAEIELNNSNYSSGSQNTLIGTALSLNYKDRNFLNNASVLSVQLHGGLEFDLGNPTDVLYSVDALASANWQIPRFVEFPKTLRLLNKVNIIPDRVYSGMQEKAQSKVSGSYNRLLLFNFYNYHSFNGTFGYDYAPNSTKRILLNPIGINYLFPVAEQGFQVILDNNPFLAKTFVKQLFTGFLLRDISHFFSGKPNIYGRSWSFRTNFEVSGLEVFLVNKAYNAIANESETFRLFKNVEYSQYLRLETSVIRSKVFDKKQSLALRLSASIATPFGFSKDIGVPYVKQFYSGGPNSNRAWRVRELGPGQFIDSLTIDNPNNVPFYQAGDFKIEFNAEYRYNIFWRLKGALFIDGGNVWTLKEDPDRLGSQLLWKPKKHPDIPGEMVGDNFLKQIALGAGLGIRGDFTYFIIRFDMGIKMRNPYPDASGSHWLFDEWKHLSFGNGINYNLAIGYPF